MSWDLPDEAFSTTGGLLTRREVRLLCLAELDLQPGAVLWDIGAGSGAVSIVAARRQPAAQVFAVERRTESDLCAAQPRRRTEPGLRKQRHMSMHFNNRSGRRGAQRD